MLWQSTWAGCIEQKGWDSTHLCFNAKNLLTYVPTQLMDEKCMFCKHPPSLLVASTLYVIKVNNTVNLQTWS